MEPFLELLTALQHDFRIRLNDFWKFRSPFRFVENPWSVTVRRCSWVVNFWPWNDKYKKNNFLFPAEFRTIRYFQEKWKTNSILEFYTIVPEKQFENLAIYIVHIKLCLLDQRTLYLWNDFQQNKVHWVNIVLLQIFLGGFFVFDQPSQLWVVLFKN